MDDLLEQLAQFRRSRTESRTHLTNLERAPHSIPRPGRPPSPYSPTNTAHTHKRSNVRIIINDRDRAIAKFAAIGATNIEIAEIFGISLATVSLFRNSPLTRALIEEEREKIFSSDNPKLIFKSLFEQATRNIAASLDATEFRERQWATDTVLDRTLGKPTNRTETTDTTVRDLFTALAQAASVTPATVIETSSEPVPDPAPAPDSDPSPPSSASLPSPEPAPGSGPSNEPPLLQPAEFTSDVAEAPSAAEAPNGASDSELSDEAISRLVGSL